MDTTNALIPFEVSTMAMVLVSALWVVTIVAAIFRWRVFDKIRVVYRFATEFERRVHRRFSDSNRQRAPFGSVLAKLAAASTAALVDDENDQSSRRLARRYEKNRGDEMLALLQRTLIGEAGGWTPTPDDATSQLPTIGHAVRFALNENPILARLGMSSLSFVHRAVDCAPWAICAISCAASSTLIALALQLLGGPDVFQGPSFVGFAVCLAPIISAGVLAAFLYVFYRFFDPDRLYDRTVQKLTGSLEVLWQDASQQRADSEFHLPSDVNAPVPDELVGRLSQQEAVSEEDVRFLTGNRHVAAPDEDPVTERAPTLPADDTTGDDAPIEDEPEEITLLADLPTADAWDPPQEPAAPVALVAPVVIAPPPPPPAPVLAAPAPVEEDWSLTAPMTPQPPAITAAGVGNDDDDDQGPATMPEFSLPKEMTGIPSPLWPEATVAPATPSAPIALPPPAPVAPVVEERTEWAASVRPLTPPSPTPEDQAPPKEDETIWNAAPLGPEFPEPSEKVAELSAVAPEVPKDEPKDEATLWNLVPAPEAVEPTAAPAPRPTVTVRRAASAPAAAPSGENTGEWSLSGSHDLRAQTPFKEEVTQEVPLRPVATAGAGASPTVVRRAAPAPVAAPTAAPATPAPQEPGALWGTATPTSGGEDDRVAVLKHRLSMVEQYLQKATADFSQGAISEAMWQEETERWSLEREKLVRELAQLVAKKRNSDAA